MHAEARYENTIQLKIDKLKNVKVEYHGRCIGVKELKKKKKMKVKIAQDSNM